MSRVQLPRRVADRRPVSYHRRSFRYPFRRSYDVSVKRHRIAVASFVVFVVLAYVVTLFVILSLHAADHLNRGKAALERAKSQLAAGTFAPAIRSFANAKFEFSLAQEEAGDPFVSLVASIPFVGRTPDAMRTAANVGLSVAEAGNGLASAVQRLPGGLDALSFAGGRLPVGTLERLAPAVTRSLGLVEEAQEEAGGIATTFVPGSIAAAGDDLRSSLQQSTSALTSADAIVRALPGFAGMSQPQRYLLVPQDSAELRGTGGAFSFWAILTIDHGKLSLGGFHSIQDLAGIKHPVWPSPAVESVYDPLNAAGDWNFANAPADATTAAGFITGLWNHTGGAPIDGVIMVDVQALRSMVKAIGPVQVDGIPFSLGAGNVVSFLTNGAYFLPGNLDTRTDFVGLAAIRVFQQFLDRAKGYGALQALVDSGARGHILLDSTDPALQREFATAGLTGALAPTPGQDLFSLTMNNLSGTKVDYYLQPTIDYEVTLLPDGEARGTARLTFENDGPPNPPPKALVPILAPGSGPSDLQADEVFDQATITCGADCTLVDASIDATPLQMTTATLGGLDAFSTTIRIPPQGSTTLVVTLDLGHVWVGDGAQGGYTLHIPALPTIRPATATVTIRTPEGMPVATTDPRLPYQGTTSTWRGSLSDDATIRIGFQRDVLGRVWWDLRSKL